MRIVTIGVYGFDDRQFFDSIVKANIDVFIDTRRRRAVRGAKYSFANSLRLQSRLGELGIPYVHRLDLAPSDEARQTQDQADSDAHIRRRERNKLSSDFISKYSAECLTELDSRDFVTSLGPDINSILLLCVEREPDACHRSLLANYLAGDLQASLEHLVP